MVVPEAYRIFFCARCGKLTCICRKCYRNNHYCASGCASTARKESTSESKSRYRNSEDGRITQKFRQRRFRSRQGADVTDQSSAATGGREISSGAHERETEAQNGASNRHDNPPVPPGTFGGQDDKRGLTAPVWKPIRCDFCGRICGVVREGSSFGFRGHGQRWQKGQRRREKAQEKEQVDRNAYG